MPSISASYGATAGARRSSPPASPSSISVPAAAARPRPACDAKAWRRRERARRARCGRSSTPPAPPPSPPCKGGNTRARAEASERSLKLLTNRYRRRKATITEVVDAQSAYAEARVAYYQAIADLSTARLRLEVDPVGAVFTPAPAPATSAPGRESCALGFDRAPQLVDLHLG